MNKLLLLVAVLGLGFFWLKHQSEGIRASAYEAAAAKQSDPCDGKKFCATIYVAPWCPACKAELPRFRGYLEKARTQKDYGLKIVVGRGQKPGDNEAMAKQIGAGAVTDDSGETFDQLKVTKFPSFYILDREKSVVLADMEAFQWMHEKF
jgi:thiol-disulfide isomerase/thioredoxin